MTAFGATQITTRRLLLAGLCAGASLYTSDALAGHVWDEREWIGSAGIEGDWFDASNWDGAVPDSYEAYTRIGNGGTASLTLGQDATVRELRLGENSDWSGIGGHLIVDNATLRAPSIRMYNTSSLVLENASILQSNPQADWAASLLIDDTANVTIDFASGTYNLNSVYHEGTGALTQADGVELVTENIRVRGDNSQPTWTQNGGSLTSTRSFGITGRSGGTGIFVLNAGQVDASMVEIGRDYHPFNSAFDGTGTINQYGGTFESDTMIFYDTARYNQHGGTLHVESALTGAGTLDFTGQAGVLTFGEAAQWQLDDLTVLNAGQTAVSGGQNGVLYVDSGFDPSTLFGSFDFAGRVIEDGAPIHIQPGEEVALSGIIDEPVTVDGAISHAGLPVYLKGPTTIRGDVDLILENSSDSGLIVDGHTTRMDSGSARFSTAVGDGSALSRFELLGGELEGRFISVRGLNGGTAEMLIDGGSTTTSTPMQVYVAGDHTPGSTARITHRSGTLNINSLNLGYADMRGMYEADMNDPTSVIGGESNEYILDGGEIITGATNSWLTVNIGSHPADNPGDGAFTHLSGSFDARTAQVFLGRANHSTGTYDIHAGDLRAGNLFVGYHGQGRFVQHGGSVVVDGFLRLGESRAGISDDPDTGEIIVLDGGDGLYQITGGSLTAGQILVSKAGVGIFDQQAGTVQTGRLQIGESTQQSGLAEYRLSEGTLDADAVTIGRSTLYRGKLIQTGGTANLGGISIAQLGTYELLGGQMNLTGTLNIGPGKLDFGDGDAIFNVADEGFANFNSGMILGGANTIITGSANSVISIPVGFDTSRFASFSSDGLIHVAGEDLDIPGGVFVGASGNFFGGIRNNGILAPGNSPGRLTINGDLQQMPDAELQIELGGTESSKEEYDQLIVTGSAMLDGQLKVSLYEGFVPHEDDTFDIIRSSNVTGEFDNIDDGRVYLPGGSFAVNYNASNDKYWLFDFLAAPGDLNGDGVLTNGDISAFVQALTDSDGYASDHPGLDADQLGDFTGDDLLTNGDIAGFVAALTASTGTSTIPEPTSLALLGLGGLLVTRRRRAG